MQTYAIDIIRHWRILLIFAVLPALTNCSRIDGSVDLNNSEGEPYSFEGATVEAFDLDPSTALGSGEKTKKGIGSVTSAEGTISLQVITVTIYDNLLYDVEIRCPANNTTDDCNVESPLHLVLTGAQLKAGGWNVTALSEAVFHNIAYYAGTDYSAAKKRQMLDRYADALLKESSNTDADYANLITWSANVTDAVRRPYMLGTVSEALATGAAINDIRQLTRQWVGPYVAQLQLPATENVYLHGITLANNYAYLSTDDATLRIIDINNPEQPTLVAQIAGNHTYEALKLSGNHLYSEWEGSLFIVDVSNPQQPVEVSETHVSYDLKSLAVAGDYVYGLKDGSFVIVDASDPSAPVVTAEVQRGYLAIAAFGTTVAVSDYSGFHLIDASNPAAPVVRSRLPFGVPDTDAELPETIVLSQNHAYAANYGTLSIIDISNLDAPSIVATLDSSGILDMTLDGTQLYLTGETKITRVDVSNPAAPVVTAVMDTPRAELNYTRVAAAGELLYALTLNSVFSAVDIDRASGPVVQSGSLPLASTDDYLHFLATADDKVYLQPNHRGFSIIDTSNPSTPAQTSTQPITQLDDATVIGDHVLSIDDYQKALSITDVSNPATPVTLDNRLPLINRNIPFDALRDIAQSGNQLYVPWGFDTFWGNHNGCPVPGPEIERIGGLFVINASTPTAPALTGQLCLQEYAELVAVAGNHAYLALGNGLLQAVNISNPATPTLAGTVPFSSKPNFLAISGNYLWATEGKDGIEIIDISNPAAPAVASHIDTAGHATSISFSEHYAYVADGISGILMFDISNPAVPVQIASANTQDNAVSVAVVKDSIYAATKSGIEVLKTLPENL